MLAHSDQTNISPTACSFLRKGLKSPEEKDERRKLKRKERGKEEKKREKEERRMVRGRLSEARPPRVQGCGKSRVGLLMDLWKFMVGRRDGWRNHK